jgi:hypothetical protein
MMSSIFIVTSRVCVPLPGRVVVQRQREALGGRGPLRRGDRPPADPGQPVRVVLGAAVGQPGPVDRVEGVAARDADLLLVP